MKRKELQNLTYEERLNTLIESYEEFQLPTNSIFVLQYLREFRPVVPPAFDPDINEDSAGIADILRNICTIDPDDVSEIMWLMGYELCFHDRYSPSWAMSWQRENLQE